jgi:hypothetical protein
MIPSMDLLGASVFLAFTAIILLVMSEVLSLYYGKVNMFVSKKRVRNAAWVASAFFLTIMAMRIVMDLLKR